MPDECAEIRNGSQAEPAATARAHAPRAAPRAVAGVALAGVALAASLLAACSTSSESGVSLFAEPGKYQYHSCEQIAEAMKNYSARRQELKTLMDRAEQSAGGAAVGFIAYKAEYVATGEELESMQSSARSKNCAQDQTWRSSGVIR
jgi:hypothetical protein